jgi:uracil phosphoribosyltransferase
MNLKEFTQSHASQVLSTQSRRADLSALELGALHFQMGQFLAYHILEDFELTQCDIAHVQGKRSGFEIAGKEDICVMGMLRAGLFAAEGIRSIFKDGAFFLEHDNVAEIINKQSLESKTVIVVDAVINTGKSISNILNQLIAAKCEKIVVAALVLQDDAKRLANDFPTVSFYALRISENRYKGTKGIDTGNRLFNTLELD